MQFELKEGRFTAGQASLYARKNDPVDFAAKIVRLVDDPALRTQMGEFGRKRIENELEWRHEARNLLAAYRALENVGAQEPVSQSTELFSHGRKTTRARKVERDVQPLGGL